MNSTARKSTILLMSLLVAALFAGSCRKSAESEAGKGTGMKAAFLYVGTAGDGGWNYAHEIARKGVEKEIPGLQTTAVENVTTGADAERVITRLIMEGYRLIFYNSFECEDAIVQLAARNPGIFFENCGAMKTAPNVGTYFGRMEEPRYLTGIIAGKMTKSNRIGYVAAHPVPEVIRGINAFALGVREVNRAAEVQVIWTHTWYNPGEEREAAEALLDAGCDIITQHQDSTAPQQAAEARGALSLGFDADMKGAAPEACLTSSVWDWTPYYAETVKAAMEGSWKSRRYYGGMKEGIVALTPLSNKVPDQVKKLVEQKKKAIMEGTLRVFRGPIFDLQGTVHVPAGKEPTYEELFSMDYFIAGVKGKIEK